MPFMKESNNPSKNLPPSFTVTNSEQIATLWSGYGSITRLHLGAPHKRTAILKRITPPSPSRDDEEEGHRRKVISYEVERWFYTDLLPSLKLQNKAAKIPTLLHAADLSLGCCLLLEDLSIEYPLDAWSCGLVQTKTVLRWLAGFHVQFWGWEGPVRSPPMKERGEKVGVWEQGGYWYLDTRRSEFEDSPDSRVKAAAKWVDEKLKEERRYMTLLHGDLKAANIVFKKEFEECAMYDFQYVGRGLGMRDVVYFLATSVSSRLLTREGEAELLNFYYRELTKGLEGEGYTREVMQEHFALCMVDWMRFMEGWGTWGNASWVKRRVEQILDNMDL
ncbi:hypothetical protein SAICODRAFT_30146 [Saitoella complicata NRRL Y-17804]|uniref:CHK kinase-like domain-containing protein n=1 Tax=Saitoella complicata (strain BCRC 22490 / CBS 7301 / JCM 7358 / NBRC 10748 / NRRL Y-17804) TaxID=698492 RepID=A0A0E9NMI7_SAICN|nr:uncharacterized protein SAICODRAFT_30146 [Saitoella complicata NRRL Y-17804]ODQ53458.1 hypothetical protein SAICODRAFT_30146 [Saitoella complicata NRRL Y-17804]GAO51013.1 hypothetical protein G7K_5125-t1 [Saitoella complicata NRRL Y-17804]